MGKQKATTIIEWKEVDKMIGKFRQRMNDERPIALAVVVAVFLVSAAAAAVFNHEGNTGAQVAEAAGRVNRQVDDTRAAFTDIKGLIPEEERLEAVPPDAYADEPTSGATSRLDYTSPTTPGRISMREHDSSNNTGSGPAHGINPTNGGASRAPESIDGKDEQDEGGDAERAVPPTLTFNQKAREIQGNGALTQHREAMDRIVDNWRPQYKAAKREHQELVERIDATRELWPEYLEEQISLIHRQGNPRLREVMRLSLANDTNAYDQWRRQASDVEMRSAEALSKIEDMNTFILFYKNQSDFKAITKYDDLDVPLQVGLLLESLYAFEEETAGLAEAMKSS